MRYLYGKTDEKYVKGKWDDYKEKPSPLSSYCFHQSSLIKGDTYFNPHDVPIQFKVTPDTLLILAAKVVDKIPMPSVYTWTNVEVCKWLRDYGYPKYQGTFRENLIHGRSLLLVDAAALSAMNIKNFDDIKHIAYGIRCLYFFELTKFGRSISLPPQYYYELYKNFRTKSGRKFELTCRSELYRQWQLIRQFPKNLSHWEKLERRLARVPDPEESELIGGTRRKNLYKCKSQKLTPKVRTTRVPCDCMPPCECYWTKNNTKLSWKLTCLPPKTETHQQYKKNCDKCMPPCTCHWITNKFTSSDKVLSCLQEVLPEKYGIYGINRSYASSEGRIKTRK